MENNSNPWGVGSHSRADWASDLNVKIVSQDPAIDILFWVGCAGAFDERNKKIARSLVKILHKAGVNFGILGTEENCTGESARRAGNEYLYQSMAQMNIDTLNKYNIKKIVTTCPHCYNTIKNEYPQMGGNYEVFHHSEFIQGLVKEGKIKLKGNSEIHNFIYHDSCYLGRYNNIFQEPRNLLSNALGGRPLEASDHHSTSLCCGAGGAQMWMEEKYERVNIKRTNQLLVADPSMIATACPFCLTMISDGIKDIGKETDVKIKDIAEIVIENLET